MFDMGSGNRSIYFDGVLDATQHADGPYRWLRGVLKIGLGTVQSQNNFFNGLIDQLSFTNRTKTSQEILRDATLTVSFPFDDNSTHDQGPLSISGSVVGNTSFVSGRRGQALQIDHVSDSYLAIQGLVLLKTTDRSYSFSIWIKTAVQQKASIIHISSAPDGT